MSLFSLTTSDQVFAGANPHRLTLVICPPSSGNLWVFPDSAAAANSGILLSSGMLPLVIDRRSWGSVVSKAWHCIHSTGGVTMPFAETIFPPRGVCPDGTV